MNEADELAIGKHENRKSISVAGKDASCGKRLLCI
jgi:hypothetical protein